MRKELVWAGAIGILFGLVIAFGAWRLRSSIIQKDVSPAPTESPMPAVGRAKILINKPNNLSVVTESPTNISGITNALTWVIISTDDSDYLTQSQNDGSFALDVDLSPGLNHIKATSVNAQGELSSQDILAVYSSSFKESFATPEVSTEASEIEKSVALKMAQTANPPKSYIGTITDITDSTIQIKSTDSQIQQISTETDDISVVNTKGTSNKTIKITDIAIGDFIIAMGYVDGNEVLDAQRILVADSPVKSEINISMQKVESVSKKTLTVSPVGGGDSSTVTPDKNTSIQVFSDGKIKNAKITDISESDLVITVSDVTGSPTLCRSIFGLGSK